MANFDDLSFSFADFSGIARLFPLPNMVLFPHVMQPLHIFEPRYRQLLEDALAGDRMITMALLSPGWQRDYEGRPPVDPMACLGRITTYHQLEDGTYNLLLLGVRRVRLVSELMPTKPYREARVEVCHDSCSPQDAAATGVLQRQIREALMKVLPMLPEAHEQLDQLLGVEVPLGVLTDVISFMLDIQVAEKQALLTELNVCRRAELLLGHLVSAANGPTGGKCSVAAFPPDFSVN